MPADQSSVDVAIVGAGLAGLTAARDLVSGGVDSTVVLEARDRVGGRTLNQPISGGEIVEGGGEYVGPTQTAILDLIGELGLETFRTYTEGETVYHLGGSRFTLGGALQLFAGAEDPLAMVDTLAAEVPVERPWEAPRAAEWDAMTVEDWLRDNPLAGNSGLTMDLAVAATLGATPAQVSMLWFLFYVRSAGGLRDLLATSGGAQDSRVVGGSQVVSLRMAEELGERVRLSAPVRRVSGWGGDAVTLETDAGTFRAGRAVLAMMPADMARIEFNPPLPERRRALIDGWTPSKKGLKAQMVYETPFWRDAGLSGQAVGDVAPQVTFDNSPPSGSPGVILAFVDPDYAPPSRDARRDWLAERLVPYFGEKAAEPIAYVEMDWTPEPWTAGCVSPIQPGLLTSAGPALSEACGRIHWAGTETADVWNGYMDGAVRSGRRVARELLATRARSWPRRSP